MRMNKHGIGLIETIAAVVILSFVMVSVFTIIVNVRTQSLAANKKINAIEVGTYVRNQLQNEMSFDDLSTYLDRDITITSNSFDAIDNFPIDIFSQTLDDVDYAPLISVTFHEMTSDHLRFDVIDFTITIKYFSNRTIDMEGVIYE